MRLRKLFALMLALILALTATAVFAEAPTNRDWNATDYETNADIREALEKDYTGKTVILHSNDVHGQIDGYAYIAGLRDLFMNRGAQVILADAGDFSQGTTYVISTKGKAAIDMMNVAGYDVVTLGNHEFDFGYEQLMENLKDAKFTTLCCDVIKDEDGSLILPASAVVETASGLKVGFIGVETPETATKVNPGLITEISFASFDKLYESTQAAVNEIRDKADLVIGLFHLGVDAESKGNGYRSTDTLKKVTGIDFVIDGHSHTVMTAGQDGEPIQSTGTKFANIGVIVIDDESKGIEANFLVPTKLGSELYGFKNINEETAAKAKEIMDKVDAEYNAEFAKTEVVLNGEKAPGNRTEETNLGDLITDALVWYVVKEGGIEQDELKDVVGIQNGGGIRATIPVGDVSKKDITTVLPFGNTVAVVFVTGAELLESLEASTFCTPDPIGGFPQTSGIDWTLDTTKAYDQGEVYMLEGKDTSYYGPASINRVTINSINGNPFDPDEIYAVITNNFCAVGGDTYNVFANSGISFDTGITLDEAVMAYISEALNGVITEEAYGQPKGRVTVIQ